MPMTDSPTLIFGTYRLDVQNATLERDGRPVALTPKAFSVLHHLARHAGRLVTKEEFLDAVWPGVFVGDAALKVCVREIRKAHRRRPAGAAPTSRPRTAAATASSPRSRW